MVNKIEQELMDALDGCVKDGAIDFEKWIAKLRLVVTNPESIKKFDELERELKEGASA